MQAHLARRQEGTCSLEGSVSALGEHKCADACQRKEGFLANRTSQIPEFHAPLLQVAALLAVLLQAVPEYLQQALPPGAGRKRIPKHPPITHHSWREVFNSGTDARVALRARARLLRPQLQCQCLHGGELCTSANISSCNLAGMHSTSPCLGIQKMSSGSSLISHDVWQRLTIRFFICQGLRGTTLCQTPGGHIRVMAVLGHRLNGLHGFRSRC